MFVGGAGTVEIVGGIGKIVVESRLSAVRWGVNRVGAIACMPLVIHACVSAIAGKTNISPVPQSDLDRYRPVGG